MEFGLNVAPSEMWKWIGSLDPIPPLAARYETKGLIPQEV